MKLNCETCINAVGENLICRIYGKNFIEFDNNFKPYWCEYRERKREIINIKQYNELDPYGEENWND